MSYWLKQSTAVTIKLGPFVDDTDGKTAETGLTIAQSSIRLSKNGGDFAQSNNSAGATHDENGYYDVPLDATDTNTLGRLVVAVSISGALPVWAEFMVVPANVYDSLFSSDRLQVDVRELGDSSLGLTTQMKADVNAEADTALSDYDPPTNAEMVARTLPAADYFDPAADTVANVTTVSSVTGAVGSVTGNVGGDVLGSVASVASGVVVTTNNDKTGYALTAAYDAAKTAAQAGDAMDLVDAPNATAIAAIQSGLATVADIAALNDVSAAEVADAVWDEALAGHTSVGSAGAALSAAGSAGDPWATELPGAYGTGTAGKIIGDNLNAPVGTIDTIVDAIKAKTDNLPASPAAVGSEMTLTSAYDAAKTAAQPGDAMTLTSTYDAAKTAAQPGDAMTLTSAAIDNILDEAIDGSITARQALKALLAFVAGKTSGAGTEEITFKSAADGTTTVIVMTVNDNGERSEVTMTL